MNIFLRVLLIFICLLGVINPFILQVWDTNSDSISPDVLAEHEKIKLGKDCRRVASVSEKYLDWYDRKKLVECGTKGILNENSFYDPFH